MAFPSSTDSFAGFTSSHTLQQDTHAAQSNQEQSAIVAIENKVGLGASTPTSGNLLRGNGTGTSAWAQAQLASDVAGILAVTNGGTGSGSSTGSGAVVLQTSPTITSPTESGGTYNTATLNTPSINYTNGSIPASAIASSSLTNTQIASGGVNFSNLLSTIFGGQVQTQANAGTAGGTYELDTIWVGLSYYGCLLNDLYS